MTINLITKGGGGGGFTTRFISGGLSIAAGVTGTLFTLTPPAGQKVKITSLTTDSSSASQSGISLTIDGNTVTNSGLSLASFALGAPGVFGVSVSISGNASSEGIVSEIIGGVDEEITLVKDAGNTTQTIVYSYEFGE